MTDPTLDRAPAPWPATAAISTPPRLRTAWLAVGLTSAMLAGCWDDSSSPPVQPPPPPPVAQDQVPPDAFATVSSFDTYALALIADNTSDTTEPLKMDLVTTPPVDDTAEPIALP